MRYYYDGDTSDDEDAEALREDDRDASADTDDDSEGDELDDDPELEADFPRGDGTADTTAAAFCPYCGELNELAVDPGGGSSQSYVEDCHVCCRPWRVTVSFDHEGHAVARLDAADD